MSQSSTKKIQAIKGMSDILPREIFHWQKFESIWRQLMWNYGYNEIRFPVVEATGLFKRSIGEVTDIVEKEMFTFLDRDNESITLRPEGTAGCVRAGIENGLFYHNQQRLWYIGPMFRYEKPQKGRYRQFNQVGLEAYGFLGPDIEIEQIVLTDRLWRTLGIQEALTLQINSLGSVSTRQSYRNALVQYFTKFQNDLDEDSRRRLVSNPLRILDSKNPKLAQMIEEAPKSHEYLNAEDKAHFEQFQQGLSDHHIGFEINPRIVRGLDYYNRSVYEWVTDKLGAQGTLCAGGRYDTLVEQLGGDSTPAVGFAIGIERVVLLLENLYGQTLPSADIYFIAVGENAHKLASLQIEECRDKYPKLRFLLHCGGGTYKSQFKWADKSGAKVAFILGEDEVNSGKISIKFLREERAQVLIEMEEMEVFLNDFTQSENGGRYEH